MAVFKEPEGYDRIDWDLLQNGSITLYWKAQYLDETVDWLKQNGYKVAEIDCSTWNDEKDMHEDIADVLNFPGYYGKNLDALNDCMGDIEIPANGGQSLVMKNFDAFSKAFYKVAWIVLDILETTSRFHLLHGRLLVTLLHSNDPEIKFDPVGALSVNWNRKEWLNKNRGL
jgi:RNAse (barnase) inhibitor barstar